MSVGTADLQKAVVTAWNASSLNALFIALGGQAPILQDQEAIPTQPYPYCVLNQPDLDTEAKMSSPVSSSRHIRNVIQSFSIYAKEVTGDSRTPKEIASYLAEEVMKVFGGHPTETTPDLTLDNGNHLITQYQNDVAIRLGDDQYQWNIDYIFKLDVPVMA